MNFDQILPNNDDPGKKSLQSQTEKTDFNVDKIFQDKKNKFKDTENQLSGFKDAFAENFFEEINPHNLRLEQVKKQLEDEVEDLRVELAGLKYRSDIQNMEPWEVNEIYEKKSGMISQKLDWIQHIDNFFATYHSDPFDDAREILEEEEKAARESIKNQKTDFN